MSSALQVHAYDRCLCGTNAAEWHSSPPRLTLASCDVHVWCCRLAASCRIDPQLATLLDDEERSRAARFRFDTDRQYFILRRIALRLILGSYLGQAPEALRFERKEFGKPIVAGQTDIDALQFNLTHSAGIALIAVARGRAVGIDVERIDPEMELLQIARQFTTPREYTRICQLPRPLRSRATLQVWVRKEAYAKACGVGVTGPLQQVDVSDTVVSPPAWGAEERNSGRRRKWKIRNLDPAPDYAGALVVERGNV